MFSFEICCRAISFARFPCTFYSFQKKKRKKVHIYFKIKSDCVRPQKTRIKQLMSSWINNQNQCLIFHINLNVCMSTTCGWGWRFFFVRLSVRASQTYVIELYTSFFVCFTFAIKCQHFFLMFNLCAFNVMCAVRSIFTCNAIQNCHFYFFQFVLDLVRNL